VSDALAAPRPPALSDPLETTGLAAELGELARTRRTLALGGLWGSSQALVLATLVRDSREPWLVVLSNDAEAEEFAADLATLGIEHTLFPACESFASAGRGGGRAHADPGSIRARLHAAQLLAGPTDARPRVLVASLLSLLQPLPTADELEREFVALRTGATLDVEALLERLVAARFVRVPLVERPGEVSLRGDILDVFPYAAELPLRVELFDREIESLRTFELESQRSLESLPEVALCVATDAAGIEEGRGDLAVRRLSPATHWVEIEPLRIDETAEGLRVQSSAHAKNLMELREAVRGWRKLVLQSLPTRERDFDVRSVGGLAQGMRAAPELLRQEARAAARVRVLCANAAEAQRFGELLGPEREGIELLEGTLARGFRWPDLGLVVVNHRELAGAHAAKRRAHRERKLTVRALESFFELAEGDLVVHAVHGVARFQGLVRMERGGGEEEHLQLVFAGDVVVYVPASRIDLVQRYVGSGSASPELDRVGSQAFRRRKEKVERALYDLAADLLEVQARRELRRRDPWRFERSLYDEFVRAFPYTDTKDQGVADGEIERDLASPRPMDRLLCGDVGFGKTEVALRAAFRVVAGGGQVALLVPTTVLAQQHHETFRERLADFPVTVEVLSRYVSGKRERETIERVERGEVDVLIGTHRILSADVRFARLGLLIVDEEQRFGVTHKEHFKQLRAEIDVLSLSATPIPRTLHMSLSGLRDISALAEPPEGRQEIETLLGWSDEGERIREALLREKNRGGQAFFLHNRVHSIERRTQELARLVPEVSFAAGHGQMGARQIARVMETFTSGEVDCLVSTSIVENGIDIPSAGTILIDEAEHFGLSELHQLRGRVGRGEQKSYCYLLVDRARPLTEVARERLKALEELTQLGAGFQISMKDLELRGAGNLLGPEQSGHIAAVGYDMYCRLLRQTVERLRSAGDARPTREELTAEIPRVLTEELEAAAVELELGLKAFLPEAWIPASKDRLDLLRKLSAIESPEEAEEALRALRDRFGRIPPPAEALVRQFELRALLAAVGIRRLSFRGETFLLEYRDRIALERVIGHARVELRPLAAGRAHLVLPPAERKPERAAAWIRRLLQGTVETPKMARAEG
jgi:transcription-repair coupling factor (superfamily II helicase)